MALLSTEREALFWSKVDRSGGPKACWEWRGHLTSDGHGQVKIRSLTKSALKTHRVAYMLSKGLIPSGLVIRHKCDNAPCCNPAHLVKGTVSQNVQDRIKRRRSATVKNGRWNGGRRKVSDSNVQSIDGKSPGCYRNRA